MYEPTTTLSGFGDSVIVPYPDSPTGYSVGRYTGESRPESESYEIKVLDPYTGEVDRTAFFHKEDIWKNTKANAERLKENRQA